MTLSAAFTAHGTLYTMTQSSQKGWERVQWPWGLEAEQKAWGGELTTGARESLRLPVR